MFSLLKIRFAFLSILMFLGFEGRSQASQGLIFGVVQLKSGETLTGQIRWDYEQALWDDVFLAVRNESPTKGMLTKEQASRINTSSTNFEFDFMQLWADKSPAYEPSFACSFGDIAYLKSTNSNVVLLGLKNGHEVKLDLEKKGDLDDRIILYDKNRKKHTLYFKNIRTIRFRSFDNSYPMVFGEPMYAKVLTTMGVFEGYFTWDMEEHMQKDAINGRKGDTKVKIYFKDIAEIRAQGDGSLITLTSGKSVFLNKHDDVGKGNRGIMVMDLDFGKIKIDWRNFISASFLKAPKAASSFASFAKPQLISGTVKTKNGDNYRGQVIFGLEKVYTIEFLNGTNNGFRYYIPFFKIDKLEPQNDKFTLVTIKNGGGQFLLGEEKDVTKGNKGVIVKNRNGKVEYISWKSIKSIDVN